MPQRRQSSSWHHSLANERSELRQKIRAARVRYFQRTTLSPPGKYDAVGLFEPLQVGLAAQGDRELLVLALEARQGARRQRRAVLDQHVRADAGLQAAASEQILVSPLHAVAIAVAERQAFLQEQSAIFAGGPGRAVARSVENNGTRGEFSQGNRYRG